MCACGAKAFPPSHPAAPHPPTHPSPLQIAVTVPVKLGLLKGTNTSDPDAVVSVYYKEEWVNATEGADILPNPGAIIANKLGAAVNAVTTLACPTKCCKE